MQLSLTTSINMEENVLTTEIEEINSSPSKDNENILSQSQLIQRIKNKNNNLKNKINKFYLSKRTRSIHSDDMSISDENDGGKKKISQHKVCSLKKIVKSGKKEKLNMYEVTETENYT